MSNSKEESILLLGADRRNKFVQGAVGERFDDDSIARQNGIILRDSVPYAHPEFDAARTATPLMIQLDITEHELYGEERFGPISFIIRCDNADAALNQATAEAQRDM